MSHETTLKRPFLPLKYSNVEGGYGAREKTDDLSDSQICSKEGQNESKIEKWGLEDERAIDAALERN